MTEILIESIFGVNAGIVWDALNKNGPCTIADLAKITSLSREEVHGALGWLRENKISLKRAKEGKAGWQWSSLYSHKIRIIRMMTSNFAKHNI